MDRLINGQGLNAAYKDGHIISANLLYQPLFYLLYDTDTRFISLILPVGCVREEGHSL